MFYLKHTWDELYLLAPTEYVPPADWDNPVSETLYFK
jgi:hypothetical protein